jgi:hypothetical protein
MANYGTGIPYQNAWGYGGMGQQMIPNYGYSGAMQPQGQQMSGGFMKGEIEWVDGEAAAKSYQIPAGTTKPVALWDTNDTVIYLKSMNPMGMPNPLQKIHYRMEEQVPKYMWQDQGRLESGDAAQEHRPDMTQYVRKDELEAMKDELKEAIESMRGAAETKAVRSNGKSAV